MSILVLRSRLPATMDQCTRSDSFLGGQAEAEGRGKE